MKKTYIKSLFLTSSLLLIPSLSNASPGGLDSNGGHTCRTNCSQYGLETGEYHYHRNGEIVRINKPTTNTSSTNVAYNDALKQGNILKSQLTSYNQAINSGDIIKINKLYDSFTKQLKNLESKIGKVSGSSNRSKLNEQYVTPAKVAIERTIYEVSQHRLLNNIKANVSEGNLNKAITDTEKLERLKKRAEDIKKAGGYLPLPSLVNQTLRFSEADIQGTLLTVLLGEYDQAINSGEIYRVDGLYDKFTKQLRLTETKIGQVWGGSKRANLNSQFVVPAKVAVERTIYEVSQIRLLESINNLLSENKVGQAESKLSVLDRLKLRADAIKEAGGYAALPSKVKSDLEKEETQIRELIAENAPPKGEMEVHTIDVGQGDSTLIVTPGNKTILIDGGKESEGDTVLAYLAEHGITSIDLMIASHPDADHIGGLVPVLENLEVKKVIDSGKPHTTQTYLNYLGLIDQKNIPFEIAKEGSFLEVDPTVDIQVLNALEESSDTNDSSIVLKVSFAEADFLLTGDADTEIEAEMIAEGYDLDSEVLKVGHHGSDTSTSQAFLEAVSPIIAVISVGDNSYGHPSSSVLERLSNFGVDTSSTIENGDIVMTTDGKSVRIDRER